MKKITSIEFVNYKAFYGEGEQNKITIPEGKNLLIYGENGSGKTSVFEGLKQFITASSRTAFNPLSRHILVPPTYSKEKEDGSITEVLNNVAVKLNIWDNATNAYEEKVYSSIENTVENTDYISKANRLNSFLSYRELLRTYLMDDLHDKAEFRRKFGTLVVEAILAKQINSATNKPYIESWNFFKTPRLRYKEIEMQMFSNGMKYDILRINSIINDIIKYFDENIKVELILDGPRIEYFHLPEKKREGLHPLCNIDLKVSMNGISIENDEENHLTVLNEARLSALAISIYFASLINTNQPDFDYKLLFLDDIFIGLDTSNRLPLLKIINEYRKPKIVQQVDEESGEIVEVVKVENGNVIYDDEIFFSSYQIFISTYDRFWFDTAKRYFETHTLNKWQYLEMFSNRQDGLNFDTPIIYTSTNYLQKANYFYSKHDYPSCAIHLRKAVEERIKVLLPVNEHYATQMDQNTGIQEFKKLNSLSQYIDKFIDYCKRNDVDASELIDLKNLKDWYFNPFSHDNIGTPVFKREVEAAKYLVEKLNGFNFKVILLAGELLQFNFNNVAGETRHYKIELVENLRSVKSNGVDILSNPQIKCAEWIKNGTPEEVSTWGQEKLFRFYNNKRNSFLNVNDQVSNSVYWSDLFIVETGQPLKSLLI